jgi:GT2 family glycosyltransferase
MADLDLIIVSFSRASHPVLCLESFYAHTGNSDLDVVLVDNGSVEGSLELVDERFPQPRELTNENRRFARGNHRRFDVTSSDYHEVSQA